MFGLAYEFSGDERPKEIRAAANRLVGYGSETEYYFEDKDGNWYRSDSFMDSPFIRIPSPPSGEIRNTRPATDF